MQANSMNKKKVKVNIMGADYIILSEDDERYVIETADEVNKKINLLVNSNLRITTVMATTLACLDYLDDLKKEKSVSANLRSQIKDYVKDISKQKMQLEKADAEIKKLREAIETLTVEDKSVKEKNFEQRKKSEHENKQKHIHIEQRNKAKQKYVPAKERKTINTIISSESEVEPNVDINDYMKYFNDGNN